MNCLSPVLLARKFQQIKNRATSMKARHRRRKLQTLEYWNSDGDGIGPRKGRLVEIKPRNIWGAF